MQENAQGRWADAEPRLQRALEIAEAELGPVHPELERILWNLGQGQTAQGKFASAEANLKRSLELAERHSLATGEQHAELALLYAFQGRLESKSHFDQALKWYEKSLAEGGEKALAVRSSYAGWLRQFAVALRQRGRAELAEKLEAKAGKILAPPR
jgi:tetratricopeptide (TPR) repeat protein